MQVNLARILIVDDNPTNLKLAASVLEFAGYQVLEAVDAIQALTVIEQTPPDLILMDIALPGMDGLTLTRQLKANAATNHIRIVALTAFAMKGDDLRAKAAGCDGYLTKPIDTRKIAEQLAEILGRIGGNEERNFEHTNN
jgi:CheY-like chemotaxis protein